MVAAIATLLPAVILIWAAATYNRLITLRNTQREAWSGIDVQLRKRHELVPNLVACVQGYRSHERETLESLVAARSGPPSATAENRLSAQLRTLFAVAEAYPELKADANFQQLSASLVSIENDLQFARRYFNGAVRDFRNAVESFPSLLIARLFAFQPDAFFEVETATERTAPAVKL